MVPRRKFSVREWIPFGVLGLVSLCTVPVGGLYVSDLNLPTQSSQVERLTELEKARLAEATHLRESLANEIWPGWGEVHFPELTITRSANTDSGYVPLPAIDKDPEFHGYVSRDSFWKQQFQELKRMSNREGEIRFYYAGMAQATLLDWIMPDWKSQAMAPNSSLEDLLRAALKR